MIFEAGRLPPNAHILAESLPIDGGSMARQIHLTGVLADDFMDRQAHHQAEGIIGIQ